MRSGDVEVALAECARWIVHRRSAKPFDHAGGSAPVDEFGPENGVRSLAMGVEPQAVQFVAEPFAYQVEARCQRLGRRTVGNEHHLRALRAALHHHLQIAGETNVRHFRIGSHRGIDEGPPHDRGDTIDQRVLHAAVRDGHHSMAAELEHPDLRRTLPSADGEPGAQAERARRAGDDRKVRQSMEVSERLERRARSGGNARLTVSRAAGARRTVRARGLSSRRWPANLRSGLAHVTSPRALP